MSAGDATPRTATGRPLRRRLFGWISLGVAASWLLAFGYLLDSRSDRDLIVIEGTVGEIGTGRAARPGGRLLFTSPYLSITLESPRFLKGPYRPSFRYAPPPWAGEESAALVEALAPGEPVSITVDSAELDGAIARLAARHEIERGGGVYNPSPFERPASVGIVALSSEATAVTVAESPLLSTIALMLCLLGAIVFALAGAGMLRSRSDPNDRA